MGPSEDIEGLLPDEHVAKLPDHLPLVERIYRLGRESIGAIASSRSGDPSGTIQRGDDGARRLAV